MDNKNSTMKEEQATEVSNKQTNIYLGRFPLTTVANKRNATAQMLQQRNERELTVEDSHPFVERNKAELEKVTR